MNQDDLEQIFHENEKSSFQMGLDLLIEEADKQQTYPTSHSHQAYAYPQDQFRLPFMSEHGNTHHGGYKNSEWIFRNKVIPGLSGFFTLEGINHPEDEMRASEFNKIDVDDLAHGDMNLNLNKFFEETENRRNQSHHHSRRISISEQGNSKNIHSSTPEPVQENKMSFFKEFLPNMFNHHWADVLSNPSHFHEFESDFPISNNVENLLFLEEHKPESESNFQLLFTNCYKNMIEKLRLLFKNNQLNAEGLIKLIHDGACNLLFEVFQFIKNCNSDYCFNLMKQKTALAKMKNNHKPDFFNKPESNVSTNLNTFLVPSSKNIIEENKKDPITNSVNFELPMGFDFGRKDESRNPFSQQADSLSMTETESVISESNKKALRKYWSDKELDELDRLSTQYYPNNIPTERLEEFAKKYGRTLNSVQSKISKTRKSRSFKKSTDIETESIAVPPQTQRKYEVSLEKMVTTALRQMPGNIGTKDEILEKIKLLFSQGQAYFNEETFANSISQTLSSSKNVQKLKGTYGLRSPRYAINSISQTSTTKMRLQFILTKLPNYRGDIGTIRKLYWDYFQDLLKNDKEKLWEKSIAKVLKQSDEFDSSDSKTKYKLVKDSP